ncbi:Olfactory receptor 52M1 [Chelonia mydas]|uniref:Olfactory receptor 52M1 n=1 Tax=Chelonia mydas TaxID=8469 RepID=M7BSS4_CHEMY|nr:Olfactory receptor 52M1 [Chelonia mydas]
MSNSNTTHFSNPSTFSLLGIPGLEAAHVWISIPFCTMYIPAILGNISILFIVKTEPSLHEPMYYFLCMLAVTDLVLYTSTVPKMLSIFWFNSREINFSACLTQMYFVLVFSMMQSGILVAMALDRYAVAWSTNIIPQPYCAHIAVVNLACADTRVSSYYGLFVRLCVLGLDGIFIAVSYTQILRAIFSLPTKDTRLKTLGTCGSHIFVILAFYIPGLFMSLMHRFAQNVPLHFQVLIGNMYLLLPPVLNPIIYGVRTKQIRDRLLQLFTHKGA